MKSLYEQLGGTYHMGEDGLLYPDLLPPGKDTATYGKYGRMCLTYLKQHRPTLYTSLLISGKLNAHLNKIDDAANAQIKLITKQMAQVQGVTEEYKATDQMAWVSATESIRTVAKEIVVAELIDN